MVGLSRRTVMIGGVTLCAATACSSVRTRAEKATRPRLPIPAELRADPGGTVVLNAQRGTMRFRAGRETETYGVNGPYLGPAVRLQRGQKVVFEVRNGVPQEITMHWHGLIIPGAADGGPHQGIPPGKRWWAGLSINQPAATLWFHPHFYPTTAELVTKGLAGLIIIDDDETGRLPLPSRWGIDDIPLIIQDRRFTAEGQFFERLNIVAVTNGYVGDTVLVNGALYPEAHTTRGWLRFRVLDGSNARTYTLSSSDGRSLYVIASDGGLLETPVELKEMPIHAGERFEVLVDARDGREFDLMTLPVAQEIMRLPPFDRPLPIVTIRPDGAHGKGRLPDSLATLPPLPDAFPPIGQELIMDMYRDKEGMMALNKAGLMAMGKSAPPDAAVVARIVDLIVDGPALSRSNQLTANGVNGKPFALAERGFTAPRDKLLRWRIAEGSDRMLHPVHIHGCQFRIVSQDGHPPEPQCAGWKDVAPISAGGASEILVQFPYSASANAPYMAHCHILEHEDSGMMTQFTVS